MSFLNPKRYTLNALNGFTLVELMISLSLFSIFITIAIGGYVVSLRTQRQARVLIAVNNNIGLFIEQIAREIRTGYDFCIESTDPVSRRFGGGVGCEYYAGWPVGGHFGALTSEVVIQSGEPFVFRNSRGEKIIYKLRNDGFIEKTEEGAGALPITPDTVFVEDLRFIIQGANNRIGYGDNRAQRITISLTMSPREQSMRGFTNTLQTTISPRFPSSF